ncbi:hypothetical protein [Allonocardiopsis opalescens]|nr:hypothetical protein [Allonocardiopsis opalescens]
MWSLLLLLSGTACVWYGWSRPRPSGARPRPRPAGPGRVATPPVRLTEAGRATLVTVGGSFLIIAVFTALSGV